MLPCYRLGCEFLLRACTGLHLSLAYVCVLKGCEGQPIMH